MTLKLKAGFYEVDAQENQYPDAVVHPIRVVMEYATNSGQLVVGVWKSWAARDAGLPPIRHATYTPTPNEYAQFFALQNTGDQSVMIFLKINEIIDTWLLTMTEEVVDDQGNITNEFIWATQYEQMPESEKD